MIKKIELTDIDELSVICEEQLKDEAWSKQQLFESLTNENYICNMIFDQEIQSFIIALKSVDDINILLIATKEKYKRCGYATTLINQLQKIAQKENLSLSLEVKQSNTIAINLYKKLGFVEYYKRKNYYKDGTDAIIMFYNKNK